MSRDDYTRAKELFLEICDRGAEERLARLDRPDVPESLRREVEALLARHDEASRWSDALPADPPVADITEGEVFAGRYRLVEELGSGGSGRVFRAHDLLLDQPVALKRLRRTSDVAAEQMRQEVRLARRITHPNVCRVFDLGEFEGSLFLTMEHVDGEDLASLLRRVGRLPEDKVLDLAHQLCSGLAAAHAQGVLHRDLKPENVLIDGRGRAHVTDFGISVTWDTAAAAATAGTPAYIPPEIWEGRPPTAAGDLYSLGLVLHEMLTGEPVFRGDEASELAQMHRSATPAPPSHTLGRVQPQLEAAILLCLEKNPAERPASAVELARMLPGGDRLQASLERGETPSPDLVADAGPTLKRRRGLGLGLGLLALGLAATFLLGDRAYPSRAPWRDSAPVSRAERAARLLGDLGYPSPEAHRAWGFRPDYAPGADPDALLFWYRQSPDWMVPGDFEDMIGDGRISYWDPPPLDPGMAQMELDAASRLVTLSVVVDPETELAAPKEGDPGPWDRLLGAAGVDRAQARPVPSARRPPVYADERRAWLVPAPGDPDATLRIEAAALGGRAVFFDIRRDLEEAGEEDLPEGLWERYWFLGFGLWLSLSAAAALLAWRHFRSGRGDLRGARRLALVVLGLRLLRWAFVSDHAGIPDLELDRAIAAAGAAVVEALAVWVAYLALEPVVRRHAPKALVSWSRVLRGRLRDPLAGRDALVGAVLGTGWVLLTQLDRILARGLGLETAPEPFVSMQLDAALSSRHLLAHGLTSVVDAVYWGLLDLFLLVGLQVLLRRPRLGFLVFFLVTGTLETLEGIHPAVSWLTLGVGIGLTTAWALQRFGLLTGVVGLASYFTLLTVPATLRLGSWMAEAGIWATTAVFALGLAGYWTARQSRPLGRGTFSSSSSATS